MGNLYQHTHTYANIQREKCFCINFLPISYYDKLVDTINHNDIETDEFAVGSFTLSNAKTIHAPAIQEAFINMECTLKEVQDLSGAGITAMIVGQVQHISVEKEACPLGKAPTASTTATLAMGDALAVCLLKRRGFSTEDFLLYHPSGTLGKGILYMVKDLMLKDKSLLPIAHEDDTFLETVDLISKKKLGCALIVNSENKLTGLLTDGDIRRILLRYPDVSVLTNKMIMTKNPKTIAAEDMATKALAFMEKYSITSLAVCDEGGSPIGIIHIHDLLRAGVA